jgi:hypothetical protein
MRDQSTFLVPLIAVLVTAAPAMAQAGYDPTAKVCSFQAKQSFYGHELTGPEPAADLIVDWEPASNRVIRYQWYLPRGNPGGPYSTLTDPARAPREPTLSHNTELGRWVLSAFVDSHLPSGTLTGHLITALLFPRHGVEEPEWLFAGIFQQTGSGYISATGTVTCR